MVESFDSIVNGWRSLGRIISPDPSCWWMAGGLGACFPLVRPDGTLNIYFGARCSEIRTRIGIATFRFGAELPDLIDLTAEPIFDLGETGCFDADGVSYPWIVQEGGRFKMYYVGWLRLGGEISFQNQPGLAVSEDGIRFRRHSRAPLLPLTDEEPVGFGSVCVESFASGWRMFYTGFVGWERAGSNLRPRYNIRRASSNNGYDWRRDGTVSVDFGGAEEFALGAPALLHRDGREELYFTARGEAYRLYVAVSENGSGFRRVPAPIRIETSDWDSDMQCYCRPFRIGERLFLLYSGNGYGRSGAGLLEWVGTTE
jgi:hypothetical protein